MRECVLIVRERLASILRFSLARSMHFGWQDVETAMLNGKSNQLLENDVNTGRVEATLARLSREDSKLCESLLNAAVAGAVVARQPADTILRAEAAEAWNSIKPAIVHHLTSQQDILLPWAESRENFPPDLILRAREQRERLCDLAKTVDAASFITGSDEEVIRAGTALTAFAVCLDDVIDGEERDLFPMIQRSLFEESSGTGA